MKGSPNLDLLRSIAVGLVVLSHVRYFLGLAPVVGGYSFDTMGRLGVAIFFVHTTLVLMMSMERHGSAAVPFFIRRFFRLYPLALFMILLTALMTLRWGGPDITPGLLAANLLMVQNITGHISIPGPLWSLPFEVQMYLVLPALYAITQTARLLLWVTALCLGSLALGLWLFFPSWVGAQGASPFHYIPCFLPGVLAFVMLTDKPRWSPAVLFALVAAVILCVPALVAQGVPETPLFWGVCLLLGVTIPKCRPLLNRPLTVAAKTVATYSYGVYLTHMLALWYGFEVMAPYGAAAQWGMFVFMLAGLAYAAYHGIEKRGIRLGVRLAKPHQDTVTNTKSGTSTLTGGATGAATVNEATAAAPRTSPPAL